MPVAEAVNSEGEQAFVLLHGLPGGVEQMRPLLRPLGELGATVLLELPDCGASPDELSLDPELSVLDLARVVEALAPKPVTVVGLSLGAWAAARLASRAHPENLRGLVLLAGFSRLTPEHLRSYHELAAALSEGRMAVRELVPIATSLFFPSGATPAATALVAELILSLSPERAARNLLRAAGCAREDRAVARYDLPAILLHGARDVGIPLALGEALAAQGANATIRVLDTDCHYLTWSHTDACVAAVKELMQT